MPYIDKDVAISTVLDLNVEHRVSWLDAVIDAIDEIPTAEVVKVVRCKDCKYWHREIHNGIEYFNDSSCDLSHYGDGHNFYCADGKRKESEDAEIH